MIGSSSRITITGKSLFAPIMMPRVVIEKGQEGSGIVFTDKTRGDINLSLESLRANQSAIGARYLYIGDKDYKVVRVPEHLLSALYWKGVNDVRISTDRRQIPLDGPGIKSFCDSLTPFDTFKQEHSNSEFHVVKAIRYDGMYKGIPATIEAIPSAGFCINILGARHPDLPYLDEKPFLLLDARKEAPKFFEARAVARLKNAVKYCLWKGLSSLGFGINESTYLIATPKDTAKDIRNKMQPQYRDDGNEHLAHTAICDFPGELLAVAPNISGTFILKNTNHITRMAAIRYFIQQGALVEK